MNSVFNQADNRNALSRQYHAAVQCYLSNDPKGDLELARELGRRAVLLELDTLDMARIHEIAMAALVMPGAVAGTSSTEEVTWGSRLLEAKCFQHNGSKLLVGRAALFFAEALTPIEQTHRGAREANLHLNQIIKALSHRTVELADSNEELRLEILLRKTTEAELRESEETMGLLLEASQRMQEELRELSRELLTIQEEERRRISRELHDVIAQTLTGINVQLSNLKAESTASTKELQQKISTTQQMVEKSVDIVHQFARELRPSILDDLGLIPALKSYLNSYFEETGIRASMTTFAEIEQCSSERRTVLFRIAQEALTNVARHAKATSVSITITRDQRGTTMKIVDDGQGFEMKDKECAKLSHRLGLLGMRERAEMVGGTFEIAAAPNQGTTVTVILPAVLLALDPHDLPIPLQSPNPLSA